ncbi:MAG: FlgD immunoglobulin-like domain containing protein, partial [bacterium]
SEIVVSTSWTGTSHKWHTSTHSTSGGTLNLGWQLVASGNYGACSVFEWMNDAWNAGANAGYDAGSRVFTHFPNHASETSFYARGWWISNVIDIAYLGDIFIDESDWHDWDYDNDISYHEFGHAFMDRMQDWWWPDNTGGSHTFTDNLHKNFAWTEGWATAYAQFVETDEWYNGWFPIYNPDAYYQNIPEGFTNEARVAAALTDLFDTSQDGDDFIELPFSLLVETIRDHNNDDLVEFWDNLKPTLSQSDKHYASRALIYNTIDIPLEPAPPPLSLTITGPTSLQSGQTGTFTANPSSGSGTYVNYRWWKRIDGGIEQLSSKDVIINAPPPGYWFELTGLEGQQTIQAKDYQDFSLKCEVTDSEGNTATDIHSVYVGGGYFLAKEAAPDKLILNGNFPNPFNPVTNIRYALPEVSEVAIVVYDLSGNQVMKWVMTSEQPGYKSIFWDGRNSNGQLVSAGVYICQLTARSFANDKYHSASRKMILIK